MGLDAVTTKLNFISWIVPSSGGIAPQNTPLTF